MSRNLKAKKFPPKIGRSFQSALKYAQINKDVEKAVEKATCNLLEEGLTVYAGNTAYTHYPHKTDGVVTVSNGLFGDMSVLVEAKRDSGDLSQPKSRAVVIAQSIFYLKRFKDAGDLIPSALVFADMDQVFALPTSLVINYLEGIWGEVNEGWSWSLSPSGVSKHSIRLIDALSVDSNLRPFVRPVDDSFDAESFIASVYDMASAGEPVKIPVTALTLEKLFLRFNQSVFGGILNAKTQGDTVSNQDQISIFIASLKGSDATYLHPKQPNVLVHGKKSVRLNSEAYESFWNHYDSASYTLDELKAITEIADTLINDVDRRFHGDFWTPVIWVNKAHEMITEALGEDWKESYTVWDPACGSKNLTRDYYFNNLYLSTLHEEELEISSDYNPEASGEHTFAYDFLNDDVDVMHGENAYTRDQMEAMSDEELARTFKMPVSLIRDLLAKKPFVFIGNPPYGSNGNGTKTDGRKGGIANTKINQVMPKNYGHAKQELYTQFIYRVQLIAEKFNYSNEDKYHFFFFNKGFLTSPNFKVFVDGLTSQFHYNKGFMINAGEFNGTSSSWGIIFSHWSINGEKGQKELLFDVLKSRTNGEIEKIAQWNGAVHQGKTISSWLNEVEISKIKMSNYPLTKNGFDPPTAKSVYCVMGEKSIGYLHNHGGNVQYSDKYTGFYSFGFAGAHGREINKNNLTRAAVTFSIRRADQEHIADNNLLWVRDKDIFTAPSDELFEDKVFIADCMIYSLFDRQSNQTSLRNFEYNGHSYRVINEFFPFSREFIKGLAVQHRNMKVQQDVSVETKERIVYAWLQENEEYLSVEAMNLLKIVEHIYEMSFAVRAEYDHMHPRYQVQSWDAGWVQINRMIFGNDRIDDQFLRLKEDFIKARKKLGERITQTSYDDKIIAPITPLGHENIDYMINNQSDPIDKTYLVYKEKDILTGRTWILYDEIRYNPNVDYYDLMSDVQNLNELLEEFSPCLLKQNIWNGFAEEVKRKPLAMGFLKQDEFDILCTEASYVGGLEKSPKEVYEFIFNSLGVDTLKLTGDFRIDSKNEIKVDFPDAYDRFYQFGFQNDENRSYSKDELIKWATVSREDNGFEWSVVIPGEPTPLTRTRALDKFGVGEKIMIIDSEMAHLWNLLSD